MALVTRLLTIRSREAGSTMTMQLPAATATRALPSRLRSAATVLRATSRASTDAGCSSPSVESVWARSSRLSVIRSSRSALLRIFSMNSSWCSPASGSISA